MFAYLWVHRRFRRWSGVGWLRRQDLERGRLALRGVGRNESRAGTHLSPLLPHACHHLRRRFPHDSGLRVSLLINHRPQKTAASTFRLRNIIRSQQPVARGAPIVAIKVRCRKTAGRQFEKEAGSGLLWSEVTSIVMFICQIALAKRHRKNLLRCLVLISLKHCLMWAE